MNLIILDSSNKPVSSDTTKEFEKSILIDKKIKRRRNNKYLSKLFHIIYKLSLKFDIQLYDILKNTLGKIKLKKHSTSIAILMGPEFNKTLPNFYFNYKLKSIYLFDAWEKNHKQIITFVNYFQIDYVFVSSLMACQSLKNKIPNSKVHWIPEGIAAEEYKFYHLSKKNIDVLAIGRKYEEYHNMIVDYLNINGYSYAYEKIKGEIIFKTRAEFIDGLARSKISICIPSNITHPQRAGNIETMTIRYLQSMLSKCIILGHAPSEIIELFGYNPVIEIDYKNPQLQITDILKNMDRYKQLIDLNYNNSIKYHTWTNRWIRIKTIINSELSYS